jgi:isopentenyl phosphate kinase
MLTFIKLGGSLITDKAQAEHFHADVTRRVATEITAAFETGIPILIGHGSGSFGHVAAQKHGTMDGVHSPGQWRGFAEVATVARRLNAQVVEILFEAGLPIFGVQPSASARCENGRLLAMEVTLIAAALERGLVPVVYGDVALDSARGGTIISTETIFAYLAERLHPSRMFLLGETEGVYDSAGAVIPRITPANINALSAALGGARGADVTGGMATKVRSMLDLAERVPGLEIRIFGGNAPGQIRSALMGETTPGTAISQT